MFCLYHTIVTFTVLLTNALFPLPLFVEQDLLAPWGFGFVCLALGWGDLS